ncbi:MAG: T9SS type A sorting domain-containing protein [Bacteroidales bacterium]|nr:T9SS type A sorting domain-containing protein [Bacteroidales bacterium]
MKGRVVCHESVTNPAQLINLSGYQPGFYHLEIMVGDRTCHQKIVKY